MNRRRFLNGSLAALASAWLLPARLLAGTMETTEGFEKAQFVPRLDDWFHVNAHGWKSVQLVAVEDGPASSIVEQFSLRFRGSANAPIAEGCHQVVAQDGWWAELYLQPSEGDGYDLYYRATFSVFRPLSAAGLGWGA